jgi:four helix bundle protein
MRDYRHLVAWQRAHSMAMRVYEATRRFPDDERFGLLAQIRRSAVSVPSNIAEGAGRATVGEFKHFLSIAAGSASELQYQLELAGARGYLGEELEGLLVDAHEVKKLIWGLRRST